MQKSEQRHILACSLLPVADDTELFPTEAKKASHITIDLLARRCLGISAQSVSAEEV